MTSWIQVFLKARFLTMPTIFEQDRYRFFFYSNDHEAIHVHIEPGDAEASLIVADNVTLRENHGFKQGEIRAARQIAEDRREEILAKWKKVFG